jgi:hypothetical protein
MTSSISLQIQATGFCENGIEPTVFVKVVDSLDQLRAINFPRRNFLIQLITFSKIPLIFKIKIKDLISSFVQQVSSSLSELTS